MLLFKLSDTKYIWNRLTSNWSQRRTWPELPVQQDGSFTVDFYLSAKRSTIALLLPRPSTTELMTLVCKWLTFFQKLILFLLLKYSINFIRRISDSWNLQCFNALLKRPLVVFIFSKSIPLLSFPPVCQSKKHFRASPYSSLQWSSQPGTT